MTFRYNRTPTGELPGNSLVAQSEAALSALSGEATEAKEAAQAAQTAAEDAASQASAAASSAAASASAAESAAQSAAVAQQALTVANRAETTAQQAVTTATAAATAAQAAQTEAENAASDAEDAADAAAQAVTDAQTAQGAASAAQTAAESAQTSAGQAATLATQAQSAAAQSAQSAQAAQIAAQSAGAPVGSYVYFAGSGIPEHYLLCNGSAVSREDYSALYAVIGDTYGAGDGSTTFNLPNLIDKFLEGSGTSGTEKAAGLPNITGVIKPLVWATNSYVSGAFSEVSLHSDRSNSSGSQLGTQYVNFNASASSAIYGNSSTVQPPALTALPCIRYE